MAEQMTFFRSYYEAVEELDDGVQLEVLRAIIRYGLYGEEPQGLSPYAKMAFTFARPSLDKSSRRGDVSRENGAKGGRPKKPTETQENPIKPTETQENPEKPHTIEYRHKTIDSKTKDNDYRLMTVDDDIQKEDANASKKEIIDALVAKWNSYTDRGCIPTVRSVSVTSKTGKSALARVSEHGIMEVVEVMDSVFESDYLRGLKNGWCAKFDWVFLPNNYEKIMNGNYKNKDVVQTQIDMLDKWSMEHHANEQPIW